MRIFDVGIIDAGPFPSLLFAIALPILSIYTIFAIRFLDRLFFKRDIRSIIFRNTSRIKLYYLTSEELCIGAISLDFAAFVLFHLGPLSILSMIFVFIHLSFYFIINFLKRSDKLEQINESHLIVLNEMITDYKVNYKRVYIAISLGFFTMLTNAITILTIFFLGVD
jgi:hypothetical protein